jgi:hypothetical protein
MSMNQNVGMTDRIVRIILGVVFIILALACHCRYSMLWFIPAVVALATGIVGWCGLYTLFGWNTNPVKGKLAKPVKKLSKKKK